MVDKIAVKKLGKAPKDIVGKYPIVRMLAFQCGCAMLLISISAWPQSRKSATPNNVAPTKDEKYAHYSWISGRCRLTYTDERKLKVTVKSRLPLQRSPGVVSCRVIVSVRVVAGHRAGAAYPFRTIVECARIDLDRRHLRRGVPNGIHLAVSEIRLSADVRASGSRPNLNGIDH